MTTARWTWWLVAVVLATVAAPARAQDGLIVNGRRVSASRNFGADLGAADSRWYGSSAGGGRYDVSSNRITDRRTGAAFDIPYIVIAIDPVRPRVFVRDDGASFTAIAEYRLDTRVMRTLTLVPPRGLPGFFGAVYAYSADQLFLDVSDLATVQAGGDHDIRVVDGTTGAVVRQFQRSGGGILYWLATPDGTRVFSLITRGLANADLTLLDVRTGAETTVSAPALSDLQWDEVNERLFVKGLNVDVYDARLSLVGSAPVPPTRTIAISPHTGRLYLAAGQFHGIYGGTLGLAVVDSTTYQSLGFVAAEARGAFLSLFTAPGAPRALRATVTGHDVALQWQNVGAASHFVLDVGLVPGRTDLSVYLGPDSHTSFAGVPSGTYYLRLRGGNEFGGGRPSAEIMMVVP